MSELFTCRVIAQVRCSGPVPTTVRAVAGSGDSEALTHIALRFGAVLFYLEDIEAVASLVEIVDQASDWADLVFGTRPVVPDLGDDEDDES